MIRGGREGRGMYKSENIASGGELRQTRINENYLTKARLTLRCDQDWC